MAIRIRRIRKVYTFPPNEYYVEVPKKYKKQILARFNPKNCQENIDGKWNYIQEMIIDISCPLCMEFIKHPTCQGCPFAKFGGFGLHGCFAWLTEVAHWDWSYLRMYVHVVYWDKNKHKYGLRELKKINKAIKKYIKWV